MSVVHTQIYHSPLQATYVRLSSVVRRQVLTRTEGGFFIHAHALGAAENLPVEGILNLSRSLNQYPDNKVSEVNLHASQ